MVILADCVILPQGQQVGGGQDARERCQEGSCSWTTAGRCWWMVPIWGDFLVRKSTKKSIRWCVVSNIFVAKSEHPRRFFHPYLGDFLVSQKIQTSPVSKPGRMCETQCRVLTADLCRFDQMMRIGVNFSVKHLHLHSTYPAFQ